MRQTSRAAATWQDGRADPAIRLPTRPGDPRMPRLTRIYTKTGDAGMTGPGRRPARPQGFAAGRDLRDGRRAQLADRASRWRLGLCERLAAELPLIQNELFDLGSDLATPAASQARHPVPTVEPRHVEQLERADRRAQRRRRAAGQLPAAGRIARAPRSSTSRGRSAAAPSGRRRPSPATSRSGRRSCPTSIACPTRSSSWPATRTTSEASAEPLWQPGR